MTSLAEPSASWFQFLDDRLRSAVQAIAATDDNQDDALRGLYISDDQALMLAGDLGSQESDPALLQAVDRLGLDALDAAALAVCAAPELHPRYGRLYAYLQDDVTRRLPSPRLVASLLAGDGVDSRDVLACFAPDARLLALGTIRLLVPDPSTPSPTARSSSTTAWRRSCSAPERGCSRPGRRSRCVACSRSPASPAATRPSPRSRGRCSPTLTCRSSCAGPTRPRSSPPPRTLRWS